MTPLPTGAATGRLVQVDGLRALAALSVLAYHYTTRYDQLFLHVGGLPFGVPRGYLGVNLFFAISGFVISMTLDKASHPRDFVVSRFTRLYPTYWAAVAITWMTVTAMGLPGYAVSWKAALANLTMLQGYFHIPDVDGVYWSLQVELIFYAWMLSAWSAGMMRSRAFITAWCLAGLAWAGAEAAGVHFSDTVRFFLILDFIPWFGIGMAAYQSFKAGRMAWSDWAILVICVAAIGLRLRVDLFAGALGTAVLVFAASRGKLAVLTWRPIVYLGLISYPLYLVHEKLGWLVIGRVEAFGLPPVVAIIAATACSIALATALHETVETRASSWLRRRLARPRAASPTPARRRPGWAFASAAIVVLCAIGFRATARAPEDDMQQRLAELNPVHGGAHACDLGKAPVVVVLGQSNAASHAEGGIGEVAKVLVEGRCVIATSPLPQTTGRGASVWTLLQGIVVAPLAVGDTTIREWTQPGPLRERLERHLREVAASKATVVGVFWQQGEADALRGTGAAEYRDQLLALRAILDAHGITAPLAVAKSTYCKGRRNEAIRRAVDAAAASMPTIVSGPDTDGLGPEHRSDGCHFNDAGRRAAAAQWQASAGKLIPR